MGGNMMSMRKIGIAAAFGVAVLAATTSAWAESVNGTISVKYVSAAPAQAAWTYLNDGVAQGPYYTGQYNLQINPNYAATGYGATIVKSYGKGAIIGTFCADVRQEAPSDFQVYTISAPEDAPVGGANTPMGTQKAWDLRHLFYLHLLDVARTGTDSNNITQADRAAAFEAAVWEIINETSGTYDVKYQDATKGNFYVQPYWWNGDWMTTANSYLADVTAMSADRTKDLGLGVMTNDTWQDYALIVPGFTGWEGSTPLIPEPLTMLGVFAGVAGVAGYIRKRGRKSVAA